MDQMNPVPKRVHAAGALPRATRIYPINPNAAKELSGQSVRNVANSNRQAAQISSYDTSGA
jgi:hypothetical protein